MIIFIAPLGSSNRTILENVYKEVFSGAPWYEDLACNNCKALYTFNPMREEYKERASNPTGLELCLKCKQPLSLVQYYPDIVNQRKLINEAMSMDSFLGYGIFDQSRLIGFTWGFSIPRARTESVTFPEIMPALVKYDVDPAQAFYGAESGVIEEYQSKGLGKVLVSKRSLGAYNANYKKFVNRTINPRMRKILCELFSGNEPQVLFKDPETGSQWFAWDFSDFNPEIAEKNLRRKQNE